MKKVAILLMAAFLLGTAHFVFNLQPDALIVIEALSLQELHDCGDPEHLDRCPLPEGITLPEGATPSTGLSVVGRGELVYLSASEASGGSGQRNATSRASARRCSRTASGSGPRANQAG